MGRFTFISYEGDDAGEVLVTMTDEASGSELHELESRSEVRFLGFRPNDESEEEDEDEEDEDDDSVQP